ncbi:MAG: HAMP domain-containing histidine kinase [Oscillospiraceae bacterium]|nr:HAMP domain-containing histidine kinase [Oscillospiraceae bacterium]
MADKSRNITQRWMINNIGMIFLVLAAVVLAGTILLRSFYYNSAKQYLSSKMNMVSSILQNSYNDPSTSFSSEVRSVVENWSDRDHSELMIINSQGNAELTSSGFIPNVEDNMEDYRKALEGSSGYYTGKISSGEKIMAMSILLPENNAGYSAVRVVSSMKRIDSRIMISTLAVIAICIAILAMTFFSGMYFVKSIVLPVRQIGATARRYAEGDFSVRIKKKNNDEIGELCDIINHMAEELANSENMKNEFISSVSHELRTPLTAIKGWSETIAGMPEDADTVSKGMRVIGAETERLSQMVEELLDFSRMQNGRFSLNKATMDVLAELGDAVLIYAERAKRDGITVNYDEPDMLPFIYGDRNRIRQVFINIIDNAIKYSDKGGIVSIQALMPDALHVEIDVSDNGCGISQQDLPKIKTKFYKANYTRRGSGIGLAVADEIVTMHGGTLDVLSEQGVGTIVKIIFPIQKNS